MKAVVYVEYGKPEVLQLTEVEKPTPKDNEVLIKIHASSINSWDWDLLRGKPFIVRLDGLLKPKYRILGADIAGRVEAVGDKVTHLKSGDDIFGDISGCGWGGFAEYVCARADMLALKPAGMTFEQAAAVPQAAVLALQSLHSHRLILQGKKVLIHGAGGGVGTFAVQIAKSYGAEVTGVDSSRKLEMLRSLGADHVIDYTQEDFTNNGQRYDLILDVIANRSIFDYKRALSTNGKYVMIGGTTARIFQMMLLGPWISRTSSKRMSLLLHKPNNKDLAILNELFESGKVVPVTDRCYPLSEVAQALKYYGEGHVQGKVVITV